MSLRKPSELFGSKTVEETNSSPAKKHLNDSYQQFQGSLFKIEELEEKLEAIYTEYPKTIEVLSEKLSNRVTKTELDNKMFAHLSVVDENFEAIKKQVKGLNKNDLKEFRDNVSQLTDIVENLIDVELPQYKNKVIRNEIKISDRFKESEDKVSNELNKFSSFLDEKINEFEETKDDLLELAGTYNKLNSIVNNKYIEQDKKIQEYSNVLDDFNNRINNFADDVEIKISDYENYIINEKELINEIKSDVAEIKADVIVYEKHVKKDINRIESHIQDNEKNIDRIEGFIQENKKDLVNLKENVIEDLSNLLKGDVQNNIRKLEIKINDIREKYDTIKPEEIIQDIQEGLLSISPQEKNSDSLTPLDQNYVTKGQLENHYRLFLNRIQQQLSTLGGGGAVNIKDMDDVDSSAFVNGKFLKYNSTSGKWEGADATGGSGTSNLNQLNVAGVSTFNDNVNIASDKQFNIGTNKLSTQYQSTFDIIYTNNNASQYILASDGITLQNVAGQKFIKATSTNTGLYHVGTQKLRTSTDGVQVVNNASGVGGTITALDGNFTGNVSIGGTLTYEDVTNIDSVGLVTARSGINVSGGSVRIGDNASYSANTNGDDLVVGSTTGSNGITIVSGTGSNNSANLFFGDSGSPIAGAIRYYHSTNYMMFRVAGGEKVRFTGTGRVGIGTINPGALLHLQGTGGSTSGLRIQNGGGNTVNLYLNNNNFGSQFSINYSGTGGSDIQISNSGNVVLAPSGNAFVGVGTYLPSSRLHVVGDAIITGVSTFTSEVHLTTTGNTLRFKDDSGNQTGAIAGNSSNLGFFGHANGNGRFDFFTGGDYRFRIQPEGDINVGTAVTISGVTGNLTVGIVTVTTPSASKGARNISISTEAPSGGSDGDLWFTYIA